MDMNMSQPVTIPVAPNAYELLARFRIVLRLPDMSAIRLSIPPGFSNDPNLVHRFLYPILRPEGMYRAAGVVHDFIYELSGEVAEYAEILDIELGEYVPAPENFHIDKPSADLIYHDLLLRYGAEPLHAEIKFQLIFLLFPKY